MSLLSPRLTLCGVSGSASRVHCSAPATRHGRVAALAVKRSSAHGLQRNVWCRNADGGSSVPEGDGESADDSTGEAKQPQTSNAGVGKAAEGGSESGSGNSLLAAGGFGIGVAAFVIAKTGVLGGQLSAKSLEELSVSLDSGLSSSRPLVVEFYADWCTTCKVVSPRLAKVLSEFPGEVNVAMVNVDNPAYANEVVEFDVDGVPQVEYFSAGKPPAKRDVGATIGDVPEAVLRSNIDALSKGDSVLPYARLRGESVSKLSEKPAPTVRSGSAIDSSDPRAHG